MIVAYKAEARLLREAALPALATRAEVSRVMQFRADRMSSRANVPLTAGRAVSERMQVLKARGLSSAELARRLAGDEEVEFAVPDERKRLLMVPNDPYFTAGPAINLAGRSGGPESGQWYLRAPTAEVRSAINAPAAWDLSNGTGVVIAVLDTGVIRDHLDLQPNLLTGYDFINDVPTANDGDARDADAADAGDWITSAENAGSTFKDCGVADSSWHGTKVSGIVAAATNNGLGMAGVAHGARVLPVRVLGKCGGFDSDIQAAMRWAAGIAVPGVPDNPSPARVLNLSLGGEGACNQAYRDTVTQVTGRGAVVVAAAGNSTGRAVGTPANCPGVIAVAGLRHAGTKVGFSDLGPEIAIGAPGGNCINTTAGTPCLYPILTSTNAGTRAPLAGSSVYTDAFNISVGTSFAAPIVSGTVALLLAAQPGLRPDEVKTVLQATARPFPTTGADNGPNDPTPVGLCQPPGSAEQLQCYCTTALCGAGMLDAAEATRLAALGVFARITVSPSAPQAGTTVTLSGSSTLLGSGRRVDRWNWTVLDGGSIVSGLSSTNASTASFVPTGAGTVTVRLTVTDDIGRSASTDAALAVAAAPVTTPPPGGGQDSGGGGGAASPAWLLGLLAAAAWLRRGRPD